MESFSDELYHYGVKGMHWGIRKDPQRAFTRSMKKLSKIDKKADKLKMKSEKASYKASKKKLKSLTARTNIGAGKALKRQMKLERKAARLELRSTKTSQKGKKWATEINKAFQDVSISEIDASYISLGKNYGLSLFEETKKK